MGNKKYTCQFCGKVVKNEGAKRLHEVHCKDRQSGGGNNDDALDDINYKTCKHQYRFLAADSPREHKAIQDGFTMVCKKCGTLE